MAQPQEFEKVLVNSATNVAAFEERRSGLQRLQHFLHSNPAMVPLIVLLGLIVFFGFAKGDRFFSAYTLTLIMQQVAVVGILAAAQTLVVLTAGIDLAIGVVMVFCFVIMGNMVVSYGMPSIVALAAGFAIGAICGYANGFLVARLRLPPFIVTLGTMGLARGITLGLTSGAPVRALPEPFLRLGQGARPTSPPPPRGCMSSASASRSAARSSRWAWSRCCCSTWRCGTC
jgi:fructose transport system permease protein